jgi:hypothetical protein
MQVGISMDQPKSPPGQGCRGDTEVGRSIPLRLCRHDHDSQIGSISLSFETNS